MNDELRSPDSANLEPALEAAVKAVLTEPIPRDGLERVKARAKQLTVPASPAVANAFPERRWKAWRPILAGLIVAATLLAALTAGLSLLNHSGGQAFAQMVENVKAASSVRFAMVTRFGQCPAIKGVMYVQGERLRCEQSVEGTVLVNIADFDRKQGLLLDMQSEVAQQIELEAAVVRAFRNPIAQLRRARAEDAEQIGEEVLQGHRMRIYRLREMDLLGIKGRGEMLVWVALDGLPARIAMRNGDPKAPMEILFEDFAWNAPLDASLFSLAVPPGFRAGVVAEVPKKPIPARDAQPSPQNYVGDGVLCRDFVPARIVWGAEGKTITALLRDREGVPVTEQRPGQLRQWDVATGGTRWNAGDAPRELAATADRKTLATVIGWEVQLRDMTSGRITHKWATEEYLSAMDFSPDGKSLAAGIAEWGKFGGKGGKESGGVQVWDVERTALLRSFPDDKPTTFLRYSPDGKHLLTSGNSGPLKLRDAASGRLTRIFPGIPQAAFSPDGRTIACQAAPSPAGRTVGKVDLYNVQDGTLVKSFASEKGPSASWLCCVAFSPDGRLLAAADWNGVVTLWDVGSGQRKLTIADHQAGVLAVAFAPDGATLATGSEDQTLRLRKLPAEVKPVSK